MTQEHDDDCPTQCGFSGENSDVTTHPCTCKKMKQKKRQISDFKLVGLSRPKSFTCRTLDDVHCFWPPHNYSIEKFNELWNYCHNNWSDKKIAEIEHDGLREDGTPINPMLINIRELNP